MKNRVLLCAVISMTARSLFASPFPDAASWKPSTGPPGGVVYVVATVDSSLFAGTKAGLYKSTDVGASWHIVDFPQKSDVIALTAIDGVVLAGTDNDGIFRSENDGEDWLPANQGLPQEPFVGAKGFAVIGGNVFAAVNGGLFVSVDKGQSWVSRGPPPNSFIGLLAVDSALFGVSNPVSLVHPTGGGLYKSNDQGATWVLTEGIPSSEGISALSSSQGFLYAATNSGVYRSADQGAHWARSGLTGQQVNSIVRAGPYLFAGVSFDGQLFRSPDEGETWEAAARLGSEIFSLDSLGSVVYSGTSTGIYRSLDGGDTWTTENAGLANTYVYEIQALDSDVYALVFDMPIPTYPRCTLYRSTDFGKSWTLGGAGLPTRTCVESLASDGSALYAGVYGTGVYKSLDRGGHWVPVNAGLPILENQFYTLIARDGLIVVAVGSLTFRSVDAGTTWRGPSAGLEPDDAVTSMAFAGNAIFAGTIFRMVKSVDGGASWQSAGRPQFIRLVAASQDAVYAVTPTSGVLKTVDGGASWTPTGLQHYDIYSFVASGGLLFAASIGTGSGPAEKDDVFVSSDGGDTWTTLDQGLFVQLGVNLAASTKAVYAGTQGYGVQTLDLFPDREPVLAPARTHPARRLQPYTKAGISR